MEYPSYPRSTVEDVARLRRRIAASGLPAKTSDRNLLVGTWNLKAFGGVHPAFEENPGSPKRNLRALALIAEVVRGLDVVAIQEVKRDLTALNRLLEWLGPDWGLTVTDVTAGQDGNTERLAYLFDRRRVRPTGLAGEIVLPPTEQGNPATQFARSPYLVSFQAGEDHFALLTAHILYGDVPEDRLPELRALADYIAREIRDRARLELGLESNLIVLGDFNIDQRGDNPLFQAFVSTGLQVPSTLRDLRTTFGAQPKHYDQIAWFMGDMRLNFRSAGVVDFAGAVFQEMPLKQMAFRVSDHLPLWVEFTIDHSAERMAPALGLDPAMPDPLSTVPD
jgi:endonuclease/exonuclease/phosphatase family metal-dependent hydrolase